MKLPRISGKRFILALAGVGVVYAAIAFAAFRATALGDALQAATPVVALILAAALNARDETHDE